MLFVFFFSLFFIGFFSSGRHRTGFGYKTKAMSELFASISGTSESTGTISRIWGVITSQMNAAEDIGSSQMVEEEEKNHLHEAKGKEKPFKISAL